MAEIKKDQERDELFRRIYKIATDLVHAGHVAEWDFKSYVLGTMFYFRATKKGRSRCLPASDCASDFYQILLLLTRK